MRHEAQYRHGKHDDQSDDPRRPPSSRRPASSSVHNHADPPAPLCTTPIPAEMSTEDLATRQKNRLGIMRTLVIGGARSGKSSEAERLLAAEMDVTYVATSYPVGHSPVGHSPLADDSSGQDSPGQDGSGQDSPGQDSPGQDSPG